MLILLLHVDLSSSHESLKMTQSIYVSFEERRDGGEKAKKLDEIHFCSIKQLAASCKPCQLIYLMLVAAVHYAGLSSCV